jgi:UDP-N-acetylglucosamine--N-acetylmuramyl-(pentapeptide) pyrophosphoryl-undecaprenol N-acetylglucosamine transferase
MIVFTCGGTGGHISPAITIAKRLGTPYIFIGGNRLEKTMLAGHPFKEVASSQRNIYLIMKGFFQSFAYLLRHRPKAVISTGGYVTFPVCMAAAILFIPIVLLEQNSIPGKTNSFIAIFAKQVFTAYPIKNFHKQKTILAGNPVPEIPKSPDRKPTNWIIMGGSQGAKAMNTLILSSLAALQDLELNITWLSGTTHYPTLCESLKMFAIKEKPPFENATVYQSGKHHIVLSPFHSDVPSLLPKMGLSISRAGAMSIAELVSAEIPTLYIPYPFAAENHQLYNAAYVQRLGGGLTMAESEWSPAVLADRIHSILENYEHYKDSLWKMNRQRALDVIISELHRQGLCDAHS